MLEKMKPIIAEQLNVNEAEIKPETKFKDDLGADSLDLFEMVMALEEEFGIEIPSEDLENIVTVNDIIGYLKEKGVEAEDHLQIFKERQETMKTRMTDLLGCQYPVIQGGMAWVAEYHLAAAVSEAGGIGLIGAASAPPEVVREQIRKTKELTDKPFGVNVMLLNPNAPEVAKVVVEEGVKIVTTGAGNPGKFMEMWKQAGVTVIPVVASVAMAKMMERAGADAVVAEGMESGGHIGSQTTMTLVPQVVDAVTIPVIAAGGIADGRGMAAAMMLGAEGVQMGTRFVVAKESIVHQNYKERIIKAKDIDSEVTGMSTGHPIRVLRNQMTRDYLKLEKEGASFEELEQLTLGSLRKAVIEGDAVHGSLMAGQSAGLVKKEQTCQEIIEEVVTGARALLAGRK